MENYKVKGLKLTVPKEIPVLMLLQRLNRVDLARLERVRSTRTNCRTQPLRPNQPKIHNYSRRKRRMITRLSGCSKRENAACVRKRGLPVIFGVGEQLV